MPVSRSRILDLLGSRYIVFAIIICWCFRWFFSRRGRHEIKATELINAASRFPFAMKASSLQRPTYEQLTARERFLFRSQNIYERLFRRQLEIEVRLTNNSFADELRRNIIPVILVVPHYPLPAITQMLLGYGIRRRIAVLAQRPEEAQRKACQLYGRAVDSLTYIESDKYCFSKLTRFIGSDAVVIACPDYRSGKSPFCDLVNPGVFEFARSRGIDIYSCKASLTNDWSIELDFSQCDFATSADLMAERFIQHQLPQRTFLVRRLSQNC